MNTIKNGVNLNLGIAALVNGGNLVNLTPHPINVIMDDGSNITIDPSGVIPRVASTATTVAPGFVTTVMGDVTGLPDKKDGVLLIVGAMVRTALPDRDDLIGPDTSPTGAVRNDQGQIVGVRGFQF
jgi:hypothetical protein